MTRNYDQESTSQKIYSACEILTKHLGCAKKTHSTLNNLVCVLDILDIISTVFFLVFYSSIYLSLG